MVLGILGGATYSMLLCKVAKHKNIKTIVLDMDENCCASKECDKLIIGDYNDVSAVTKMINECDYITYENDRVNLEVLLDLDHSKIVPSLNTYMLSCNNYISKLSAKEAGFNIPRFYEIEDKDDFNYYFNKINSKCVVSKANIDIGKVNNIKKYSIVEKDATNFMEVDQFLKERCIIQEFIKSDNIITVVAARTKSNDFAYHSTNINVYKDNKLFRSMLVSNTNLSETLEKFMVINNLYGMISVELFVKDGIYYFNRVIPGIHASGLSTLDGSSVDQFEYLIDCIFNFDLATPVNKSCFMYPLYGSQVNYFRNNDIPGVIFYDYQVEVKEDNLTGHINATQIGMMQKLESIFNELN